MAELRKELTAAHETESPRPPNAGVPHRDVDSDTPRQVRWGMLGLAGLALVTLIFIVVLVIRNNNSRSGTSHTTTYSSTSSSTYSYSSTPDSTAEVIQNAKVGDCIHRVSGTLQSNGYYSVVVTPATCGTSYATDRVTRRTDNTSDCGGNWVSGGLYSTPVVLCLSPE